MAGHTHADTTPPALKKVLASNPRRVTCKRVHISITLGGWTGTYNSNWYCFGTEPSTRSSNGTLLAEAEMTDVEVDGDAKTIELSFSNVPDGSVVEFAEPCSAAPEAGYDPQSNINKLIIPAGKYEIVNGSALIPVEIE